MRLPASKTKIRILNIVGARPNFMKVAPLMKEYQRFPECIQPTLLHTGQHYDDAMSAIFFSELDLPKPDIYLGVGSGSHAEQTARIMTGFESVVKREKPDLLLVVGDVNSTLACALVAAKEGIRIAHVEAGLRSFDRTMPEEINRIVTDSLSDLLFTTSVDANVNLIREGKREDQIFFVGNPMIDCMYGAMAKIKGRTALGSELLNEKPYAFVTLHRPSNVDDTATLSGILDAFETISEHVSIIWPLHPRTRLKLEENGMWRRLQNRKNFFIQPPVGYLDSISLMSGATFVMSDSGGVQEETTVLGVPCLTLRHNTERPVTISHGTNELVGNDPRAIVSRALQILKKSDSIPMMPALWDGNSASRIVAVIKNHLLGS